MGASRKLEVAIIGDADSLSRTFRGASRDADHFGTRLRVGAGGGLSFLAKSAGIGALAIGAGLGLAIKGVIGDLSDHEKASKQTAAALTSTGNAANVTVGHVEKLADSIEKLSGMDDVAVQKGENMLLTFTNVRNGVGANNKVFDEATRTLADMSVALGGDPEKNAIRLGKALNDPVKGVTALAKVGVTFTEGQKKQIAAMVESGNTMGAQKLILGELNREFGGSAKAAGETMGGQLNILKARLMDVGDEIGARAIPALNSILTWANEEWVKFGPTVIRVASEAVQWFEDNWPRIHAIALQVFDAVEAAWTSVLKPAILDIAAIVGAVVGLVRAHWETIKAVTTVIFNDLSGIIRPAMATVQAIIATITAVIRGDWGEAWNGIKATFVGVLDTIKGILSADADIWGRLAHALGEAVVNGAKAALSALEGAVRSLISGAVGAIGDFLDDALGKGRSLGEKVISGAKNGLASIASEVKSKVAEGVSAVGELFPDMLSKGVELGARLLSGLVSGLHGLADKIASEVRASLNAIIDYFNGATKFSFSVDTHIPGVGKQGFTFDPPDIPHLAAGGVTFGRTQAVIGDNASGREAVVPLDDPRAQRALRGAFGGGGDVTLVVNNARDLDERALAERMSWELRFAT